MATTRFYRRFLPAVFLLLALTTKAREITFCGEAIPVDNGFVAQRLMNVIRKQIPYVNMVDLRRKAQQYFPMVEYYLKAANMPPDLKYIPIVESGFRNATSHAGARGFWQLMEGTAKDWGLVVNSNRDDRDHPQIATIAAIQELARVYKQIRRDHKVSSWVLTAAAYNYGIGNLYRKISTQGKNYFSMDLNPETALYVYKIVAVKELFEYPEIYMRSFQYNVFKQQGKLGKPADGGEVDAAFRSANIQVKTNDGAHPEQLGVAKVKPPTDADLQEAKKEKLKEAMLVSAKVKGQYEVFKDGDSVYIELQEDLPTTNSFRRAGATIKGRGWVIDNRVFVDLGFSGTEVILYDMTGTQGISLSGLKSEEHLLLRVEK